MNEMGKSKDQLSIIVLAMQPRMLRQMLRRALLRLPSPRLVLETENAHQLQGILERVQADWLIASLTDRDELPERAKMAVEHQPSLSVMGISQDGSRVIIYGTERNGDTDACPEESTLEDATLEQLLDVLE